MPLKLVASAWSGKGVDATDTPGEPPFPIDDAIEIAGEKLNVGVGQINMAGKA